MIDTHAHLDFENFDEDREEVISRAFDNGVKAIVNVGVDLERSRKSIEISESHDGVFASVGLHPDFFLKGDRGDQGDPPHRRASWGDDFGELKKMAKHEKVVAVGECGLDYFRAEQNNLTPALSLLRRGSASEIRERQKKGFLAQIEIAKELNLPVIVHCREAWEDLYEIVKSQSQNSNIQQNPKSQVSKKIQNTKYKIPDTKFVLHCYSGEKEDTEKFLKLDNVCFSFSGNITYPPRKSPPSSPFNKGGEVEDVIRMIPLDRMMLDSDSPFLAPQAMRGKRNEPTNIRYIAEKIAEIKEISVERVERITDLNAINFFGI